MVYHITTPEHFAAFADKNYYESAFLASEGFIHCSTLKQLKDTADRYYHNINEITILHIDEQKLNSDLKYEKAKTGEDFPHIYGAINKQAITEVKKYYKLGESFDIETT